MIDVIFPVGCDEVTAPKLTQWDYGQKLNIYGCNLADKTQVHFCDKSCGTATVIEGKLVTVSGVSHLEVAIPDRLLENAYDIRAYVYLTTEKSGQTVKKIIIPVVGRTKPDDYVSGDDPPVHSITEAVRIANEAKDIAEEADATADAATETANAAETKAAAAETKADNAVSTANIASQNASAAVNTANAAEAKVDAQDADIAAFKTTVNGEIADQNDEIDAFKTTVNGQITAQDADIAAFKTSVNGEIADLGSQITQGLGTKVTVGGAIQSTWNADTKANVSVAQNITIAVTDWSGMTATKSVTGVTTANNIVVSISQNATDEQLTAFGEAKVMATAQGNGTVTFTALSGTAPIIALPVTVIILG